MHLLNLDGGFCVAFVLFGGSLSFVYCLLTLLGVAFEFGVGSSRFLYLFREIFIGHSELRILPSFLFECLARFGNLLLKHDDVLSYVSRHFYGWRVEILW